MLDDAAVRRLLNGKTRVIPYVGRYVGIEGMQALVDLGGQRFPTPFMSALVPEINEAVHVWSIDGSLFMLGPTAPKPGVGVVATVAGDYVNVTTDFGTFTMPYGPPSEPPTSGDAVSINWSGTPSCMKLSTSPDPVEPPPAPDPGGGVQTRAAEFRATFAGSTDRDKKRYWTDQVYASSTTYGVFTYGGAIKDTIPASAQFVSLEVFVAYQKRDGGAPRWVLHNQYGLDGVPAVSAFTEWAPPGGWQTPPNAEQWFNELKQGGAWAGVGFDRGGWNIFKSLAQEGQSGALRITWRS